MKNKPFILSTFLVALLLPAVGFAQTQKGSMRLHLDISALDLGVGNVHQDRANEDFDQHWFGFGVHAYDGTGGSFPVYVGFSGAVIDKLFIGGRAALSYSHHGYGDHDNDYSGIGFSLLPYLEYIFLDGKVRPFVTGTLGLEGFINGEGSDTWGLDFYFAGGGGAHFFIREQFSLDLTGLMGFSVGGGEWDGGRDDDYHRVLFRMSVLFGLSGWF